MAYVNNGYLMYTILQGIYLDDDSLDGLIMPNIQMISPQAIVPAGTNITYNQTTAPVPSGGSNLDIWYNQPTDTLYQNQNGGWVILLNRVLNIYYIAPVYNTSACPVPPTGATG